MDFGKNNVDSFIYFHFNYNEILRLLTFIKNPFCIDIIEPSKNLVNQNNALSPVKISNINVSGFIAPLSYFKYIDIKNGKSSLLIANFYN